MRRTLLIAMLAVALALPSTAAPKASSGSRPLGPALKDSLTNTVLARCRVGVQVADAASGRILFDHQADAPLKPASNMKVITSAAALSLLRPETVFKTTFYAGSRPSGGVLSGNLHIVGRGSPALSGEQWWLMAREIRARGIVRVEGDLVGDDSYFDERERPDGWPSSSEDAFYNAPVSALSADYNAVTIVVSPTREGTPPDVSLVPFASFFKVVNRALTRGGSSNLRVGRQLDGGRNVIVVEGNISSRSSPIVSYRSVERPTYYALAAFREAASREGISIAGTDRRGPMPGSAVKLYEHESRPLAELVRTMNKLSNNYMAESLLKTLGAEKAGPPGTTAKGAEAVLDFIRGLGLGTSGLVIADGSGLSHANRLTAGALTGVLYGVYRDFELHPEFMSSLAVGGVDGTLDRRMLSGPARRRIRAKTGYISGVSSLSGYAFNQQGKVLAFAILVNAGKGADDWRIRQAIDEMAAAMVTSRLPESQN